VVRVRILLGVQNSINRVSETPKEFSYSDSVKYNEGETFLNFQNYLLFSSKQITKFLYNTPVTPHQVILFSMIIGVASSILIIQSNIIVVIVGAVMLFYKNVLDKVDGSLARAKNVVTRRGRFYDSISDFIVSFALFTAIGFKLDSVYHSVWIWIVSYAALITSMLQCSYFVFYEVSFIRQTGKETINRLLERVTDEDLKLEDKLTLLLQRIFQVIYGWQDCIIFSLDKFFISKLRQNYLGGGLEDIWYKDKSFLSVSSLLCIGTHMFLIALFAVIGSFEYYLFVNLIVLNLLLIFCVLYHYYHIKTVLKNRKL
jgi:phosphatidylglycerophosphate synthase